ncbi:zf-RING_2 domain-containing protein, partial [Cephalotus follicularis]
PYSMSSNSHYSPHSQTYSSPPITIILTVIILVFFFVGFFSVYFCRCFMDNFLTSWNLRRSPSGHPVGLSNSSSNPGLDPSLKQYFPTFTYSSVKNFGREKYGLECAICLAEFNDEDLLRLLTVCYHVFHQECIDLWLQSHKTCPVCRGNLDLPPESLAKSPIIVHDNTMQDIIVDHDHNSSDDAISIVIKDDASEDVPNTMQHSERFQQLERFSRSKSTGHSIFKTRDEEDRYTLRLPEYVKIKITRGHNWTKSCIAFGDYSCPKTTVNDGLGEASGCSGGDINKV